MPLAPIGNGIGTGAHTPVSRSSRSSSSASPPLGTTQDGGPLVGSKVDLVVNVNGDNLGYAEADRLSVELAAARLRDQQNPERKSSGSQFYIVAGQKFEDLVLSQIEQQNGIQYSPEQRQSYREQGGYPPLDGQYTVFGRVVEGLDVIDKIATVQRDQMDRPLQDIRMKVSVIK